MEYFQALSCWNYMNCMEWIFGTCQVENIRHAD